MEDVQRHLRERGVDHKIAASVQNRIKEIIQNDGNIQTANDRLLEFAETTAGKTILGVARDLMAELNLTYTEQVFLQESGYDPKIQEKCAIKLHINDLIDTYQRLEQPISQIDGVDDNEVCYPANNSRAQRSASLPRCATPHRSYQPPTPKSTPQTPHETSMQRFRREFLAEFARGNSLDDNSCLDDTCDASGWETTLDDSCGSLVCPDESMLENVCDGPLPDISGIERINWTANSSLLEPTENDPNCPIQPSSRVRAVRFSGPSSPRSANFLRRRIASASPTIRSAIRSPARTSNAYSTFEGGIFDKMPRNAWEGFDITNPPNEQRFFEMNDVQVSYLRDALKIPSIQPVKRTVVQVGHTLIINASLYVDEKDTKQFSMGQVFGSLDSQHRSRSLRGSTPHVHSQHNFSSPVTSRSRRSSAQCRRVPGNVVSTGHRSLNMARNLLRRNGTANPRRIDFSIHDDPEPIDLSEGWETLEDALDDNSGADGDQHGFCLDELCMDYDQDQNVIAEDFDSYNSNEDLDTNNIC